MPADVALAEQRINTAEDGVRVVLPVLRRPLRAAIVHASVRRSELGTPLRPLFVLSYGDREELEAVRNTGSDFIVLFEGRRSGDYARKINTGAAVTSEPWIFTGADDLDFKPGWADAAIAYSEQMKLRAVGINDMGRWSSRHRVAPAPHFMIHRSYIAEGTADERDVIFHTGYDHNYVDTEFMWTAHARHEYGYCAESVVEHLHPVWRKGKRDPIYQLGSEKNGQDLRLFRQREPLWKNSRS
jgi:hypothetical protein